MSTLKNCDPDLKKYILKHRLEGIFEVRACSFKIAAVLTIRPSIRLYTKKWLAYSNCVYLRLIDELNETGTELKLMIISCEYTNSFFMCVCE